MRLFSNFSASTFKQMLTSAFVLAASQLTSSAALAEQALPESYFSYEAVYQFQESITTCQRYQDCRVVLSEYALLNSDIMSYDQARINMFHEVDVIDGDGERVVQTVYALKTFRVPDYGLPKHTIVNTEHTFPRSLLKRGRDYRKSQADLMHLFPAVSTVNSKRGSRPFGDCEGNGDEWKVCGNGFEPPHVHKGTIARAMFYVSVAYDLPIDTKQEETLRSWSRQYPVTNAERVRAHRVYQIQGNRNPFVDHPEWIDLIIDF